MWRIVALQTAAAILQMLGAASHDFVEAVGLDQNDLLPKRLVV